MHFEFVVGHVGTIGEQFLIDCFDDPVKGIMMHQQVRLIQGLYSLYSFNISGSRTTWCCSNAIRIHLHWRILFALRDNSLMNLLMALPSQQQRRSANCTHCAKMRQGSSVARPVRPAWYHPSKTSQSPQSRARRRPFGQDPHRAFPHPDHA